MILKKIKNFKKLYDDLEELHKLLTNSFAIRYCDIYCMDKIDKLFSKNRNLIIENYAEHNYNNSKKQLEEIKKSFLELHSVNTTFYIVKYGNERQKFLLEAQKGGKNKIIEKQVLDENVNNEFISLIVKDFVCNYKYIPSNCKVLNNLPYKNMEEFNKKPTNYIINCKDKKSNMHTLIIGNVDFEFAYDLYKVVKDELVKQKHFKKENSLILEKKTLRSSKIGSFFH